MGAQPPVDGAALAQRHAVLRAVVASVEGMQRRINMVKLDIRSYAACGWQCVLGLKGSKLIDIDKAGVLLM